jgi:hypothetical protein
MTVNGPNRPSLPVAPPPRVLKPLPPAEQSSAPRNRAGDAEQERAYRRRLEIEPEIKTVWDECKKLPPGSVGGANHLGLEAMENSLRREERRIEQRFPSSSSGNPTPSP